MHRPKYISHLQNGLIGATAVIFAGSQVAPANPEPGPVVAAAAKFVAGDTGSISHKAVAVLTGARSADPIVASTESALDALQDDVGALSHPKALATAFRSYYAYKAAHPDRVKKPYLYFVDYGQPSTERRGFVFDMDALTIVDGPFTVAHGRGSASSQYGVPTRFSNKNGSAASSLGLFIARGTYDFVGHSGGRRYRSIGLRLVGLSGRFNDNAYDRGVVAHGAPYVTSSRAGRSEGCPAMEENRAERLLPKLANGGMVFLFAPDDAWLESDPWIVASDASADRRA